MTGASVRIRADIQSLEAHDPDGIVDKYARAVTTMRKLDGSGGGPPTNPLSWRYQAALHGIADANGQPINGDELWSKCRHNSWFFLAWHRIYLYRFERIVQHHLGDDTWALPYWDYTKRGSVAARRLPSRFRDASAGNALFTAHRDSAVNRGVALPVKRTTAVAALQVPDFSLPPEDTRPTFGGGVVDRASVDGGARGKLENTPHADVHGAIGGWMGAFATAALDPVFWLHHANIDRLWEVWRALGHLDPTDAAWLKSKFMFYDVDAKRVQLPVSDILETPTLGYRYESIAPPTGVRRPAAPTGGRVVGARAVGVAPGAEEDTSMSSPELVGARKDVSFAEKTTVDVDLAPAQRRAVGAVPDEDRRRWYLRVENIVGTRPDAAAFDLYLDVIGQEDRPVHVGSIGTFGIAEASRTDSPHGGAGLTDVFDVTDAMRTFADRGVTDPQRLHVTIEPAGVGRSQRTGGDVRAGRISFYRG